MFWCKIRSKCALVSHIHAPKVGQILSAGNQGQVVYVAVVLDPYKAKQINELENIQRRAARVV